MSIWALCCLWAYVSRDHSGRFWAWGSFWLRKAQGQEKWQFPALINEHTGRSFCLQDQRPVDTCSGTEKIINKDPAFVSSWAPLNLFDLDEEEEKNCKYNSEDVLWSPHFKVGQQQELQESEHPQDSTTSGPLQEDTFFPETSIFFLKYKVEGF